MVSAGQGIAESVFNQAETVMLADCYKSQLFDRKSGFLTRSLIAVPILDFDGSSLGVLQAINKLPTDAKAGPWAGADGTPKPPGARARALEAAGGTVFSNVRTVITDDARSRQLSS